MHAEFELHPRLAADCVVVETLPLSLLLLMNDARYPWFILVPRRAGITEVYQLPEVEQRQLWAESASLAENLMQSFNADKINLGALGNLVPQLHIHHIARFRNDPAWPAPVWGHGKPVPYSDAELATRSRLARGWFADRSARQGVVSE